MNYLKILPNFLSISRIIFSINIYFLDNTNYILLIAVWSGLSDFLDGFLARKINANTTFGEKLDQLSDKIVISIFLIYLYNSNELSLNFVLLILARDIIIIFLRNRKIIPKKSNLLGKSRTLFLYILFIYLLLPLNFHFLHATIKNILLFLIIFTSYASLVISCYNNNYLDEK